MREPVAVMLSEAGAEDPVAGDLARAHVQVDCYGRVADLFGAKEPGSIPVLIFHVRERPRGRVLDVIGRMTIEYPRVPMMLLSEAPLSLEVAQYLAGHGVDVVRLENGATGEVPAAVTRMFERRQRSLAAS